MRAQKTADPSPGISPVIPADTNSEENVPGAGEREERQEGEEPAAKRRKKELDERMRKIRQAGMDRENRPVEPEGLEERIQKVMDEYEAKKRGREQEGVLIERVERMLLEEVEAVCERMRVEAQVEAMAGEDRANEESERVPRCVDQEASCCSE